MARSAPLRNAPTGQLGNAFRIALDSIRSHPLRTSLTLFGIVIGVASVVLVGAAINGMATYAKETTTKAFGSESFAVAQIIMSGQFSRRAYFDKLKRNRPIRNADYRMLETTLGKRVLYSPYRTHTGDIKRESQVSEDTNIIGVASAMSEIRDMNVVDGRFFTPSEERSRTPVIVIGETVKTLLFPAGGSPLNRVIRLDGLEFTVIGVMEKLGTMMGQDQDKVAYVPNTIFDRVYGQGTGFTLYGRARPDSGLTINQALDETRVALRGHFHLRPGEADTFDSSTPDAMRGFIDDILGMIAKVVVPITAISLVVGGIVIMNIMLMSVTERTREIGLRMSLGARRGDLMLQVLIESVLLALAGGGVGILAGTAAATLHGALLQVALRVSAGYVILSIAVSSVVGVVSGWYPARRAASLDPVVALRAE